jgi:hypothetical protein
MAKGRYDLPGANERELHRRLKVAEECCERLVADSSGGAEIAVLKAQVSALEADVCAKNRSINSLKARSGNLHDKNKALKADNASLKRDVSRLKMDVRVSHLLYQELERELIVTQKRRFEWAQLARGLGGRLREARAEVAHLKTRANRSPANSSLPPSCCPNRKIVHNSRVKTGKKPGGQPGHEGHCRQRHAPDAVTILPVPDGCPSCGATLLPTGKTATRQVTDLVVTVMTTEYVSEVHSCVGCSKQLSPAFPREARNEANYGNNIRAVVTYLVNSCNVSRDNAIGFLFEVTNHELKVSKGSVHNFLADFSRVAKDGISDIAKAAKASALLGADATHTRSEGHQSYIYTFNSSDSVIFKASDHKGDEPLRGSVIDGYEGIVLSDHDLSYYHYGTANAECNVHVLRYLKGVMQNEPEKTWAPKMYALLNEANAIAKECRATDVAQVSKETLAELERRYDEVIDLAEREYMTDAPIPAKYRPEGIPLYTRLRKYKGNHLAFLHNLAIPFDNNRSERLLRTAKKKLKQSGGFRSTERGQAPYCDYLSITQTARLRGLAPLGIVRDIFDGRIGVFKSEGNLGNGNSP